ncbi:MAG: HDOD domain-containing protein [Fimbriimonadaceae bacterium]
MSLSRSVSSREPGNVAKVAYSYLLDNERGKNLLAKVGMLMDPGRISVANLERMTGQSGALLGFTLKAIEQGSLLEEGIAFTSVRSAFEALGSATFGVCLQQTAYAMAAKQLLQPSGWKWKPFVVHAVASKAAADEIGSLSGAFDSTQTAFVLTHKAGVLVAANAFPDFYRQVDEQLTGSQQQLQECEVARLGTDHAFIAEHSLKQLAYPLPAIQAASKHLDTAEQGLPIATLARGAGLVAQQLGYGYGLSNLVPEIDPATMSGLKMEARHLGEVAVKVSQSAARADKLVNLLSN